MKNEFDQSTVDDKSTYFDKQFLQQEYATVNTEISRAMNLQMSLLTATISATIILLTLIMNFWGNSNIKAFDFDYLLFLLPLAIIIPSIFLFFEKSIQYSIKVAYSEVLEAMIHGEMDVEHYKGYRRTLFSVFEKEKTKNFPMLKKRSIVPYILSMRDQTTKIIDKIKPAYLLFTMHYNFREYRFWIISFYSFLAISLICYIITIHFIIGTHSHNIIIQDQHISLLLLFIITCTIIASILYGLIFENRNSFYITTLGLLAFIVTYLDMKLCMEQCQLSLSIIVDSFTDITSIGVTLILIFVICTYYDTYKKQKQNQEINQYNVLCKLSFPYSVFLLLYLINMATHIGLGYAILCFSALGTISAFVWAFLTLLSFIDGTNSIGTYRDKIENEINRINSSNKGIKELNEEDISMMSQE